MLLFGIMVVLLILLVLGKGIKFIVSLAVIAIAFAIFMRIVFGSDVGINFLKNTVGYFFK
jgi:hypothetical protein